MPETGHPNTILDGTLIAKLRADVEDVFQIQMMEVPPDAPQGTIMFSGELLHADSEFVYDTIATRWQVHRYTPILHPAGAIVDLVAQPGLIEPKPSDPRINLGLFLITLISVLFVGALNEEADLTNNPSQILWGLPFTLAFLSILGAHEFGHYFAARYHKVDVTLPYFIPFPTIWGTLGAFIQLRAPTKNKTQLFDVGIAGPLAGLIVALPILLIGLYLSPVELLPTDKNYMMEGNSILYWLLKYAIFGQSLPGDGLDVMLHPLAWAGWSGLFITMLNLFPIGQLDGGHIIYVLFGQRSRQVGYSFLVSMVALAGIYWFLEILAWQNWLFWAVLIFLLIGIGHPPPLNGVAPLDNKRKILGYITLFIFILIFIPIPITLIQV